MKMIHAILSQADEENTVHELNKAGYYVTKLPSSGGFLRKTNSTIMIVCDDELVGRALEILKKEAGRRTEQVPYVTPSSVPGGAAALPGMPFTSVPSAAGGCTVFVVPVEQFEKF